MKPDQQMEQRLEQLAEAVGHRDSFVDEVMRRIENSPVQFSKKQKRKIVLRSILMRNVKLTAAASILIGTILALTVLDGTVAPTYGLEQTLQALHSVRTIHLRGYRDAQEVPISAWAEFSPDGSVKQMRLSIPAWDSPEDGPKEIVWKNNAAQVWCKQKNVLLTVLETKLAQEIQAGIEKADPKHLMQRLDELNRNGKALLEIEQPEELAMPIRVTATLDNAAFDPILGDRLIAEIDQATKLALSIRIYKVTSTGYEQLHHIEFYDYNQPIDPAMFAFDNLPDDVIRVNQVDNQVGFAQGDMTNDEAAVETARRFWQAVIDRDFETAGKLMEGLPAKVTENVVGRNLPNTFPLEIVSIGPVQPHPNPRTGGVIVPCKIKCIKDGQIVEHTFDKIGVRQLENQPGRWTIFGGL